MPDSTHGPASGDHGRATPEVQKYRPRACQACARSKMRCVWPSEPGATPCQRCAKIKTPCTLPEINPRRRRGPSTRVGQLEEKIDGIMSLLNASQQIQQNSPSSSGQTPPRSSSAAPPSFDQSRSSIQQLLNPNVEANGGAAASRPADGIDSASTPPPSANYHPQARLLPPAGLVAPASIAAGLAAGIGADSPGLDSERAPRPSAAGELVEIVKGFRITFHEADRALNLYRSIYAPYFPFVPIPVMMSAHDLYNRSPFLFRSIVAVTTPQSPAVQAEYRIWFREYVAQHVVVNNERELETLQGILIHLAWGDLYFLADSQATNLTQLAVALVVDLGLSRWPVDLGKVGCPMLREAEMSAGTKRPWRKQHTLDEMRAFLGTFYVTSLCSSFLQSHQPLMCGSYLTRCGEVLAEAQEYDSDKFLVVMVRIQQLLNRGADIIPDGEHEAARRFPYTPVHMALTSIQRELETLIRAQPPEVECNALLWTHYHGAVCRLFEPVIQLRPTSSSSSSLGGGGGYYDASEATARTAALWQCLHAARDLLSAYLAIPPHNLPCMPFHSVHLSFCVATATRLLFLGDEQISTRSSSSSSSGNHQHHHLAAAAAAAVAVDPDPDWNPLLARESMNLEAAYERLVDYLGEAERVCAGLGRRVRYVDGGQEGDKSVLAALRDKIRWMRDWYVGRTRAPAPQGGAFYGGQQQQQPPYPARRAEEEDQGRGDASNGGGSGGNGGVGGGMTSSKDAAGVEGHLGSGDGPRSSGARGSSISTSGHGQPMDIDYAMPGELYGGF